LGVFSASLCQAALSHDPSLDWYTTESTHFTIHYHTGEAALAQRVATIAEDVHVRVSKWLSWAPKNKTDIILSDEWDLSNGFATVFPRTRFTLYVTAPDEINSLEDHNDWLRGLITHEYTHIIHLDKVSGVPSALQHALGRHPLLFPNVYQPRWLIEGLATYNETDVQEGIGRGQSSFFDMLMRMEAVNGIKPVEQINQPLASWPYGYAPYLYGVQYYQYLQGRYGDNKIQQLVANYSDNIIPFRLNSNSAGTFGKDVPQLWAEFSDSVRNNYQSQIAAIQQQGEQAGQPLTQQGYFAGPLRVTPDGRVYFIAYRGDTHAGLYLIAPGQAARKLRDVVAGSRLDVHPQQGVLLVQPEICRNAAIYYDLYRVDANGDQLQRLTHCARYHHAAWSADGTQLLAVHNALGKVAVHRLDAQGVLQQVLWQAQDDTQISDLAWAPDGKTIIASVWRERSGWNLERFTLADQVWSKLTDDPAIESQPQFTDTGRAVLFTSDAGGVYNIHRLDLTSGKQTTLTNVIGGAFSPVQVSDTLYYIGYTARGFDVFALPQPKTVATPPLKKAIATPSNSASLPATPPVTLSTPTEYSPYSGLWPSWWFPHIVVDQQRAELGAVTAGWDALQRHIYGVDLAYDAKNLWWVGSIDYIYDRYWPVLRLFERRRTQLYLNGADNPVRIRQEEVTQAQMILPFNSLHDSWAFHLAALQTHENDTWLAPAVVPYANAQDDILGVALTYASASRFPKSVSRSEGRDVRFIREDSDAIGHSDYSGQVSVGDWREYIHLGSQHVVALRYVEGRGTDSPRPFQLGGIQTATNPLLYLLGGPGDPLFNLRNYTLRGYAEGHAQLRGRRMRLASAEYRFPLALIERGWMVPPIGIHQLHGTLFYETGAAWQNDRPNQYYSSAGAEFNADVDVFYDLRMHMTLGVAKGFDEVIGGNKLYFRLGHNF
jgi:hypothetical protein